MIHKKTDILILGAGIGGYETFRTLNREIKKHGLHKKMTLVDQNNYFTFTPMLHEVATGSVQPSHCAIPLRELVYKTPHEFWKARVVSIFPEKKCVETSEGTLNYEYCVIALGSKPNYFGVKGAQQYSHHVRTLPAAMNLHQAFIRLLEDKDDHDHIDLVVVGGGATGVEVAGLFSYLVKHDISKLYPEKKVSMTLVQSGDRLVPSLPEKMQRIILTQLKKSGVKIMLNARIDEVKRDSVVIARDKEKTVFPCQLVVWTAGFDSAAPEYLDAKYTEKNQVLVTETLNLAEHKTVFALGDICTVRCHDQEIPFPKLGDLAHKQGMYVAKHISRMLQGKKQPKRFVFHSYGVLIPVGDWFGVAQLAHVIIKGRFAWWLRRTVYLHFLPGFSRKIRIAFDWTLHHVGFRHIIDIDCQ